MSKRAVNKSGALATSVNRLSAQQRAILVTIAANLSVHPFTGERRHAYVAHTAALRARLLGVPYPPPQATNSQRASLSRSLRRLQDAGYLARNGSGITLTAKGKRAGMEDVK